MNVLRRTVRHESRSDVFSLYPIGDVHIGNAGCQEDYLKEIVDRIAADENALWIGLGDYCEWINVKDPRFDFESMPNWVQVKDLADLAYVQRQRFLDAVEPIADKCVAMVKGNHEDTIQRHTERAVYNEIVSGVKSKMSHPVEKLGLDYCGFVQLRFDRGGHHTWLVNLFAHHGWGGGRKKGGKVNKLDDLMRSFDADLTLVGHHHTKQFNNVQTIGVDSSGNLIKQVRVGSVCGSFLSGYTQGHSSYVEKFGYAPEPIGIPVIKFYTGSERISIEY